MLTVNTLGKFQITDGESYLNEESINSPMMSKLLLYLFLYRDKTLTVTDICTDIWQNEVENPNGALKNLMYRLRKLLEASFSEKDFILSNRGSYQWNSEIEVVLDIEVFEQLIAEAKVENVYEEAIVKYEQAIAMYQGEFMSYLLDKHWIMTLNTYYHSMYLSSVKALAELYIKTEQYEELEKISSEALRYEGSDEQLYCYQIQARMRCGKVALALESYENARQIMEQEMGIRKTTILNKVYQELLSMSKGTSTYNFKDVKEDIEEEDPQGVFMCGYPIFKEIYHLEARKSARSSEPEHLLMLTVEGKTQDAPEVVAYRIKNAMVGLEDTIKESLRVGDVAARYSDTQFIILLPTCTRELALVVANRIISKLYDKDDKYKNIRVRINVEEVSLETGMVK